MYLYKPKSVEIFSMQANVVLFWCSAPGCAACIKHHFLHKGISAIFLDRTHAKHPMGDHCNGVLCCCAFVFFSSLLWSN